MRVTQRINVTAIGLCLGGLAAAPTSQPSTPDQRFMLAAAQDGVKEVAMGRLASTQGDTAGVRDYGRMMVTDHSTANDRMLTTAVQEGLSLPRELPAKDRTSYDKLSGLHGKAFDQAYVRAVIEDHQQDIAEYEREAKEGVDVAVKDAARGALPMLRHHLDAAQGLDVAGH